MHNKFVRNLICEHCKQNARIEMGMGDKSFICPNCGARCYVQSIYEIHEQQRNIAACKQKSNTVGCIILAIIIIILAISFYSINEHIKHKIPDIIGVELEKGYNKISSMNNDYTIKITKQFNDGVDKGYIIDTIPQKGKTASDKSTVEIIVSMGKAIVVPDLTNNTEDEAINQINSLGLKTEVIYEYSENIGKGRVVKSIPECGSIVEADSIVEIVVSKGKRIVMPDIIGMNTEEGIAILKELGVEVITKKVFDTQETLGKIIECDVSAGESILDNKVTIISSKGSKYNIICTDGITYATANDIVHMYKHDETELYNYDLDDVQVCITGKVKSYSISTYYSDTILGNYRIYYVNFVSDNLSLDNDDMESWIGISIDIDADIDEDSLKSVMWAIAKAEEKLYADTDYYVGTTFSTWVMEQKDNGNWSEQCTIRVYGTGDRGASTYSVNDCYKVELLNSDGKVVSTWNK